MSYLADERKESPWILLICVHKQSILQAPSRSLSRAVLNRESFLHHSPTLITLSGELTLKPFKNLLAWRLSQMIGARRVGRLLQNLMSNWASKPGGRWQFPAFQTDGGIYAALPLAVAAFRWKGIQIVSVEELFPLFPMHHLPGGGPCILLIAPWRVPEGVAGKRGCQLRVLRKILCLTLALSVFFLQSIFSIGIRQ